VDEIKSDALVFLGATGDLAYKKIFPALQSMVRSQDNLLARFHALWTLEGLGALDPGLVREQMKDTNPRMRVQDIAELVAHSLPDDQERGAG